jgi:isopenicillin-N epimerase
LRHLFLLDPEVVFLNHGSFGACPRPVFEEYQRLQLELERQPVAFLARDRRYPELIDEAKARLAELLGSDPANLVFTTNATEGLNAVARSLPLGEGDEVLAPVGEYGAVDMLWRHICERAGASYVTRPIQPGTAQEEALEELWAGITPATRAVVASHVSCFTGVVFPVDELCRRASQHGVISIVDGAHAPGQIELELESLEADFYAGNCHKWLCAPKGAGFLYARPDRQELLEPFLVSWDWEEKDDFAARRRWHGTRDPAAWLSVPAAIDFQAEHGWDEVRARCHGLAVEARSRLAELFGLEPIAPTEDSFVQMVGVGLPPCDPKQLQRRLFEEHKIEVLGQSLAGVPTMRLSFQAYNDEADLHALVEAVGAILGLSVKGRKPHRRLR